MSRSRVAKRVKPVGTIAEPARNQSGTSSAQTVPGVGLAPLGATPRTVPKVTDTHHVGSLVFRLPLPPNLGNKQMHWAVKMRQQKAYRESCDALQAARRLPAPPRDPFARATLTATLNVGKLHDHENAKFRAYKWPADWLRTRGYILDDNPKVCTMADPEQVITKYEDRSVVITLTPLTEES